MQAIRNKFHGKSKRNSLEKNRSTNPVAFDQSAQTMSSAPTLPGGVVTNFNESHQNLPNGGHVDHYEKTEVINSAPSMTSDPMMMSSTPSMGSSSFMSSNIPVPPPMPPADFWANMDSSKYDAFFRDLPSSTMNYSSSSAYPMTQSFVGQATRTMEVLPVEVIERPVVIHESIRQEQVEEIQPIVRVEREKTEIRQITQPLTDKEIRPVLVEERVLPVEVLPTIVNQGAPMPERLDQSTRDFDATLRHVVEKTPIVQETEKWRVIEEVQPIIYREVIVPHVIRTSRPMREVVVEAPVFTEQVLQVRDLSFAERQRWSSFFTQESVLRESMSGSTIPVVSIPNPQSLPIRSIPVASAQQLPIAPIQQQQQHGKKEIIEETVTTTTTTTTAPIIGNTSSRNLNSSGNSTSRSNFNSQSQVLKESHDIKYGPNGEKIIRDTTITQSVNPTLAN